MNGENKLFRIFAILAFLAFAAGSCWSTTESLFLTLENAQIPKWVFWVVVVGLFVLTSYCTKMAIDSLTAKGYVENRRGKFIIGLLGFLVLWLIFSMPTNAHTFFYKQMAKQTALRELEHVDNELDKVTDSESYLANYRAEWDSYYAKVNAALDLLKHEINDPYKLGFGDIAESKLANIENLLGLQIGTIDRRGTKNTSQAERNAVCKYYDNVVKEQLKIKEDQHNAKVQAFSTNHQSKIDDIAPLRREISTTKQELQDPIYDREATLRKARKVIDAGYAKLETAYNGLYTPDPTIYRSDRLTKVTKVWGDYFKGRFRNTDYTLWYWILVSVIVDLSAFAFFDIAFKRDEYEF